MTKILHLEIENCADCPYKFDGGDYPTECSQISPIYVDDNGYLQYNKDIVNTIPYPQGILPNCPLGDKK